MKLREARARLSGPPRARNTLDAYRVDWQQFCEWCTRYGKPHCPATSDTLALYITWLLLEQERKTSTALQHLSAVVHFHREAKVEPPETREARHVISGVRRERHEQPRGACAMSVKDLTAIARGCGTQTKRGLRDRALIVLGFATGLRRSELARLQLADVTFERQGLAVLIRHSKTDQEGRGRLAPAWSGRRASTDPVRTMKAWIRARGKWPGPLFCRIQTADSLTMRGITAEAVNEIIQRATRIAGLRSRYSAHSLRAGAATVAAELGRSDQEIMALTGHSSPEVMRSYIRRSRAFAGRNPLAGAL